MDLFARQNLLITKSEATDQERIKSGRKKVYLLYTYNKIIGRKADVMKEEVGKRTVKIKLSYCF
jgi:hypothetical protein